MGAAVMDVSMAGWLAASRILVLSPLIGMRCSGMMPQSFAQTEEGKRPADGSGAEEQDLRHLIHHHPGPARDMTRLVR